MEKLIASAIKFYDKDSHNCIIMTGIRHASVLYDMYKLGIKYDKQKTIQGFITSENRFVDRYEAKQIAIKANQLIVPEEETYSELFSEDVW